MKCTRKDLKLKLKLNHSSRVKLNKIQIQKERREACILHINDCPLKV